MTESSLKTTGSVSGQDNNPLAEFINRIPWELSVLDLQLTDELRSIIAKVSDHRVLITNNYIILLVMYLSEHKYLEMHIVDTPPIPGKVILIKRI